MKKMEVMYRELTGSKLGYLRLMVSLTVMQICLEFVLTQFVLRVVTQRIYRSFSQSDSPNAMHAMRDALLDRQVGVSVSTLSSELAVGEEKSSAAAVALRSTGNDVPASAAAPSGHSFKRLRASAKRPRSLANIST